MPTAVAPIVLTFPRRLGGVRLSSTDGAATTSWIQCAVVGDFKDPRYGEFSITPEMLSAMVLNFSEGRFPEPPTKICVDYDHLTTKAAQHPEDGKAAGWFTALETRTGGTEMWALIEWTETGANSVRSKEYQFFSPYFTTDGETNTGEHIGPTLLNGALTNRPFLQGMQPVSLALSRMLKRTDTGRVFVLTTLTDNDKRRRLETALQARYGGAYEYDYGCDVYLVDTLAGTEAIFSKRGTYLVVGYSFTEDGEVGFTGDPEEVVMQWARLSAGGTSLMSKGTAIKLTGANGQSVEIDLAQLESTELVKSLRAQLPAAGQKVVAEADFTALQGTVRELTASVETLKTTATTAQAEATAAKDTLALRDAEADVDALVRAGKVTPATRAHYLSLRQSNKQLFTDLTASLPVVVALNTSLGSGHADETGDDKLEAKAKELRTANPKLSAEQAIALALEQDPSLYQG